MLLDITPATGMTAECWESCTSLLWTHVLRCIVLAHAEPVTWGLLKPMHPSPGGLGRPCSELPGVSPNMLALRHDTPT